MNIVITEGSCTSYLFDDPHFKIEHPKMHAHTQLISQIEHPKMHAHTTDISNRAPQNAGTHTQLISQIEHPKMQAHTHN